MAKERFQKKVNLAGKLLLSALVIMLMTVSWAAGYFIGHEKQIPGIIEDCAVARPVVYGDNFFATIEKIDGNNILVNGLGVNDSYYRGNFLLKTDSDTVFEWRCTGISLSDLRPGNIIQVTFTGIVLESYPAQIGEIRKIELLNPEFK